MVDYELAKKAYDAYGDTTNHLNYQGNPMPEWDHLSPIIQMAWNNAALRVSMETNSMQREFVPWRNILDPRQQATLKDAEEYSKEPFGDVAHNLKLLIADMSEQLDLRS